MTEPFPGIKRIILESGTEQSRMCRLNEHELKNGRYVLYWMRNAQRASVNPSLNFAVDAGNSVGLPVVVLFQPEACCHGGGLRHYRFMLEGCEEIRNELKKKGIKFIISPGDPVSGLAGLSADAAAVITDSGYLKHERASEAESAVKLECPLVSVESQVIVPLNSLPGREEYAASTLRPKLKKILHVYLDPRPDPVPGFSSLDINIPCEDITSTDNLLVKLGADKSIPAIPGLHGGTASARKLLDDFVRNKLHRYVEERNNPDIDASSHLSPYLHFGQISPVEVALLVIGHGGENAGKFLDELIVRRELSFNFVRYNDDYDNIKCLPSWAGDTLMLHMDDKREYIYDMDTLDHAQTHDPYWNAAQNQLVSEGVIHNYMRMYWGKKIIEWSGSPEEAFGRMVYLNNRYALDGCDPNSYAGIAWCFGKHDRPWGTRPVFGKVRYMNDRGLERKFSMTSYLEKYLYAGA